MRLRDLELKDAPLMLEWMHDDDVVKYLKSEFLNKTLEDAKKFIKMAENKNEHIHLAICSNEDEYMGTVSLKNIQRDNNSAELAVVVRRSAMGKGYAWFALEEIVHKAFDEYGLDSIYWCISRNDKRAIRFCDKHVFHESVDIPQDVLNRYKGMGNLKWYSILRGDIFDEREEIVGCKVLRIKTIPTVQAGELSFFEATHDVDFDIKRFYYISKVPEGVRRGFHCHKNLKQLLFCPYGRIQLILENEHGREEIELSDPSIGVVIEKPTWREMLWLQKDSVLCVAASEFYQVDDYIRDYNAFKRYIGIV